MTALGGKEALTLPTLSALFIMGESDSWCFYSVGVFGPWLKWPQLCVSSWLWMSLILCSWGESMWARTSQGRKNEERSRNSNSGRQLSFNLKDPGLDVQFLCQIFSYRHTWEMYHGFCSRTLEKSKYHNKASHMIFFGFPTYIKSFIYTVLWSVKCALALCVKNLHTLILKYFIAKKC